MRAEGSDAGIVATVQDFGPQREAWAVAQVLVEELLLEDAPPAVYPGAEVKAVGDRLGLASVGERLELRGRWEVTRWGLQLRVAEQVSRGLGGGADAARWLERLDQVGPKLARALASRFGDRLPAILAGEEDADLTEVPGIGDAVARHIRESYARLALSGDLESIRYLDSIRATRWEATKIIEWCARNQRRPIEVLEGAPYDLMAVKGLGFRKVDRLAGEAGCSPKAPARLEAATLYQLDIITDRGSTMAPWSGGRAGGLIGEVAGLLGLEGEPELVRGALRRLAGRGDVVITTDEEGRTWVHPAPLLRAERDIYRAASGKLRRPQLPTEAPGLPPGGRGPDALPAQATVRRPGAPNVMPCNGGKRQDGTKAGEAHAPPLPEAVELEERREGPAASSGGSGEAPDDSSPSDGAAPLPPISNTGLPPAFAGAIRLRGQRPTLSSLFDQALAADPFGGAGW